MDEAKLQEIEARANETVLRCVKGGDCDAPARWQKQTVRGIVRACYDHVGNRAGWRPIVAIELDVLDLADEFRRYDGEEDELLRQAATQAEHLQLDAEDRAKRAERARDAARAEVARLRAEHAAQLAAVTAERDALRAERDGEHDLIARQATILTAVADALKGPPPALSSHSHHDLGAVAAATVAQLPPLVACVDALRAAATAAGWRDADATGETLVAWVRRGAMRECLAIEAPKVRALRTAVNALCNVRTLRATCAEGETWRAHVHDKDWTDARANALAVLNATGGE